MTINEPSYWAQYTSLGHCYSWRPDLIWTHLFADSFIALAYLSISGALLYLMYRQPHMPYKYLARRFAIGVMLCFIAQLFGIWAGLSGYCGMQGVARGVNGFGTIASTALLIPLFLKLVALKAPRQLRALNIELERQIGEQRKSSDKLQEAEKNLRTYLQKAPDGIILVRATGIIEYSNDMANKLFGHPPDGLTGEYITALMPNRFRDLITSEENNVFDDELARSETGSAEFIGIRKDTAAEFPVEVNISPMHSEGDGGTLELATLRNISARKEREEEARREFLEMAHVSRLSTVGQMAAGLAHELNQPLTAISNNLHTAMAMQKSKAEPDPVMLEIMQENYQSAQRAGEIIRGLRQLVSKDDGATEPKNINEIIHTTVRLLDAEVKASSVDLQLELSDDLPLCLIDAVQIQQVIVNLGRNSIEALSAVEQEGRKVKITTALKDEATIIVSVEDNGPGLTNEVKASLFQPYFTTKKSGMGLGLSICRSIVEAQGGLLWRDKSHKIGTKFNFTLVLAEG